MSQNRQPAGVPTGGQFTPDAKARADISLSDAETGLREQDQRTDDQATWGKQRFGTVAHVPAPSALVPQRTTIAGQWVVDSTVVERTGDGDITAMVVHAHGQPHRRARNNAALALIREDNDNVTNDMEAIARRGDGKATALVAQSSGSVLAIEGKLQRHERLALLRKGGQVKGNFVEGDRSLDVVAVNPGYNGQDYMASVMNAALDKVPEVSPELELDRLPRAEVDTEESPPIGAAYLIDHPGFGDGPVPGCMFLATEYDPEDDIVDGYFWAPGNSELTSEHGSMLGSDLAARGGRITGYEPRSIAFRDAVTHKIPPSRSEAYRAVTGQAFYNE